MLLWLRIRSKKRTNIFRPYYKYVHCSFKTKNRSSL
jgi:hypothetical protein